MRFLVYRYAVVADAEMQDSPFVRNFPKIQRSKQRFAASEMLYNESHKVVRLRGFRYAGYNRRTKYTQEVGAMKLSIRLSNAGLAALAGILMALFLGILVLSRPVSVVTTASSDRVEAKEFILRDSQGRERVRIAVDENDAPGITLLDKSGTRRALLRLNSDDVPSLRMYNAAGRVDSVLGYNLHNMEPGLVFFNSLGTGRLAASLFDGMSNASQLFRDEDLYPNWRSGLRFGQLKERDLDVPEWRSVPRQEPFQSYSEDVAPAAPAHESTFEFHYSNP